MAEIAERAALARRDRLLEAARRWQERTAIREAGQALVKRLGIGAADTPKRQAEYAVREAFKAVSLPLRFPERQVGQTWDLVPVASVQAMQAAEPVARIVKLVAGYEPMGVATGFLIGQDLLLTNHHVFAKRSNAMGHAANFHHVQDERGAKLGKLYELDPDRFFVSDETLDFAIVAVKPKSLEGDSLSNIGSIKMIGATGKVLTWEPVNVVQHPFGGVRQFALTNNTLVDILSAGFLHYLADTHRGSSGAPLFNKDWELIGLHHCGVPRVENGQIRTKPQLGGGVWDPYKDDDDDIDWIANEGTRVSFIVEKLQVLQVSQKEQPILQALLASTADMIPSEQSIQKNELKGGLMATTVFNISAPVTIHQYAAATTTGATPVAIDAGTALATPRLIDGSAPPDSDRQIFIEKSLTFDPDYANRPGCDLRFLGAGGEVDLPRLGARHDEKFYSVKDYKEYFAEYRDVPELDVTGLSDGDPLQLKYFHYSLVMHKDFKMCIWAASNLDYTDEMRQDSRRRELYGSEGWRKDPRVPPWYQLLGKDVYDPGKRIDRGHIVRREDSCWGLTPEATELANADTFHWTNCTPQHEAFNQENPTDRRKYHASIYDGLDVKGIWGRFEGHLAKQIDKAGGQAILFAGPVLDDDFIKSDSFTDSGARIPRKFWKVVVCRESRKRNAPLLAFGYVFDQSEPVERFGLSYPKESLDLGFKERRETLETIQEMTGVLFDERVLKADQAF
ncbi:DNA/RNA non-specific endonuclease [Acidovorax sp. CF316]|uniref:DNA/RNA non-specific endonuclease n=1 Tax=Acidovorax sp. CF316 TaxID=1144317 RepID=UPI0002E1B8C6|nr:DNA/RNA non-specific endonuclease [Acidovorax sp. CF316]